LSARRLYRRLVSTPASRACLPVSKGVIGEEALRKAVPQNATGHEPNGKKLKADKRGRKAEAC
jgi:hypothetical protein